MESLKATFRRASPTNSKKGLKCAKSTQEKSVDCDNQISYIDIGIEHENGLETICQKTEEVGELLDVILKGTDPVLVSKQIADITERLGSALNELSSSNSRLERKKAELASETLQLIHSFRSLKLNNEVEKAIDKERSELKEQYESHLQKDITEREKQLKSEDKAYYKRYTEISNTKEAKSLLKRADSKLVMWENVKALTAHKITKLEKEKTKTNKAKKNITNIIKTSPEDQEQADNARNVTRNTRQRSILESFQAAAARSSREGTLADTSTMGPSLPGTEPQASTAEVSTPTSIRRGRQLLQSLMLNSIAGPMIPSTAASSASGSQRNETTDVSPSGSTSTRADRRQQLILESLRNITETSRSNAVARTVEHHEEE